MEINLNDFIGKEYLKPKDVLEISSEWIIKDMKIVDKKMFEKDETERKIEISIMCIDQERCFTLNSTNARILKSVFGQDIDTRFMSGKILFFNIVKATVNNQLKDSIQVNEAETKKKNTVRKTDSVKPYQYDSRLI